MSGSDVFVALGSNLGDSARMLLKAWRLLGEHESITLLALSPPFLTAPVDMTSHHWFTNAVGRLESSCSPVEMLEILMATESRLGRMRAAGVRGYQDRTIDLDLLYYDKAVLDSPRLTLPHPRRAERLFVLAPLAAIAPDFIDPVLGTSVSNLHSQLEERISSGRTARQEITRAAWPESV